MFFENLSFSNPSFWPLFFCVRVVLVFAYVILLLILLAIPKNRQQNWHILIVKFCVGLILVIFGLDFIGNPIENMHGFDTIDGACYYSCKGTVVDTIEGKDCTLVISKKDAFFPSSGVRSFGDVSVYTHNPYGWEIVIPKVKRKQITVKTEIDGYTVYLINDRKSQDVFLVVYDFYGRNDPIVCRQSSEFKYFKEEIGPVYWYAHCNILPTELKKCEIQGKNGISSFTIDICTD